MSILDIKSKKLDMLENKKFLNELKELEEKFDMILSYDLDIDYDLLLEMILLTEKYNKFISEYDLDKKGKRVFLKEDEVIKLSRETIELIEPKYLKSFDDFIDEKRVYFTKIPRINLTKKSKFINKSRYSYERDSESLEGQSYIKICRLFNYNDVALLVHEFMHYTNHNAFNKNKERNLYSEFISTYFEYLTLKNLVDEKKVKLDEIDFVKKLGNIKEFNKSKKWLLFLVYYENKILSYELAKAFALENGIDISKEEYMSLVRSLSKSLEFVSHNNEEVLDDTKEYFNNSIYKPLEYTKGLLLAFSSMKYLSVEDIISYNDYLYDPKNKSDSVDKVHKLQKKILEDDTCYEEIDSFYKRYVEGDIYGYKQTIR